MLMMIPDSTLDWKIHHKRAFVESEGRRTGAQAPFGVHLYICQLCIRRNGSRLMPRVSCTCVKPLCRVIPSLRLCLGLPGHLCPAVPQARGHAQVLSRGVSRPKWDKRSTENVHTHQNREKLFLIPGHTFSLCVPAVWVFLFSLVSVRRCLWT